MISRYPRPTAGCQWKQMRTASQDFSSTSVCSGMEFWRSWSPELGRWQAVESVGVEADMAWQWKRWHSFQSRQPSSSLARARSTLWLRRAYQTWSGYPRGRSAHSTRCTWREHGTYWQKCRWLWHHSRGPFLAWTFSSLCQAWWDGPSLRSSFRKWETQATRNFYRLVNLAQHLWAYMRFRLIWRHKDMVFYRSHTRTISKCKK